jgi:hypothetical protein
MPKRQTTAQRPKDMDRIKAAVRARDGFVCTLCGMSNDEHRAVYGRQLDVHRMRPGAIYTEAECVAVCKPCHATLPQKGAGEIDQAWAGTRQPHPAPAVRPEAVAAVLSSHLRAERARLHLTLREAGERAGVHYVSISRYEQGKLPTLEALYSLAEAYGIEPTVLLPPMASVADLPKKRKGK